MTAVEALERAPVPLAVVGPSGRVELASQAYWAMLAVGSSPPPGLLTPVELVRALGEPAARATDWVLDPASRALDVEPAREYCCSTQGALRWYEVRAARFGDGSLLMYTDRTELRRAQVASRLHESVAVALDERQSFVESCRRMRAVLCDSLGWDAAAVWVPAQWGELVCADVWGRAPFAGSEFENLTRTTSLESGKGLAGRAWASQAPLWAGRLTALEPIPRLERGCALGLESGVAVPLAHGGLVLAVLELFSTLALREDRELVELVRRAGARLAQDELRGRRGSRAEAAGKKGLNDLHYRALLDQAPGFILALDRQGRIEFVNRVMPHHRRDQVIGTDWLDHAAPAEHATLRAKLQALMATGVAQHHEVKMMGPDGREVWFSTQLAPRLENGEIIGAVAVVHDVTEFERARMELAATQRWLSVGTLAAGLAHEINTPVQSISDNLHFLRDAARRLLGVTRSLSALGERIAAGSSDPELSDAATAALELRRAARLPFLERELPQAIEASLEALARVAGVVRTLKDFAQPAEPELEQTLLEPLIERAAALAASEHRAVADLELQLGELPPVRCNVCEISQVLHNLIVNAAQAVAASVRGTERRGTIAIRTWRESDQAVIAIRDTGPGIPEELRSRIFDPFFTTKGVGQGTGQGLALAWSVVKQKHGGSITFESSVGVGTTFFVRLPIAGRVVAAREA